MMTTMIMIQERLLEHAIKFKFIYCEFVYHVVLHSISMYKLPRGCLCIITTFVGCTTLDCMTPGWIEGPDWVGAMYAWFIVWGLYGWFCNPK